MAKKKKEPGISFKGFLAAFAIALGGGLVGFCFIAAAGAYMESQQKTADEPPAVSQTIRGTLPSSAPVYTSTPTPELTAPPVGPSTEPEPEQTIEPVQQTTTPTAAPTQAPTATQAPAPAQTKAPAPTPTRAPEATPAPTAAPAWNGGAVVTINPTIPPAQQTQAPAQSGGQSGSGSNSGSSSSGNGEWGNSSITNEITGSLTRTAYWTPAGRSYHFSRSCPSLSRSTTILSGTLQDALNARKTDPCNNCAGGS